MCRFSEYFIRSGFLSNWFKPQSLGPIGVDREIHREDAKSAKKGGEPAHNPLTMRWSMAPTACSAICSISCLIHCLFPSRSLRLRG